MIDRDTHMATASKDRTGMFFNADPFVITAETGRKIRQWCESGEEDPSARIMAAGNIDELKVFKEMYPEYVEVIKKRYKELSNGAAVNQ
jgi:hypothetical protein